MPAVLTEVKMALVGGGKSFFGRKRRKTLFSVRPEEDSWTEGDGRMKSFALPCIPMEEVLGSSFDKVEFQFQFQRGSGAEILAKWPLDNFLLRARSPKGFRLPVHDAEVCLYVREKEAALRRVEEEGGASFKGLVFMQKGSFEPLRLEVEAKGPRRCCFLLPRKSRRLLEVDLQEVEDVWFGRNERLFHLPTMRLERLCQVASELHSLHFRLIGKGDRIRAAGEVLLQEFLEAATKEGGAGRLYVPFSKGRICLCFDDGEGRRRRRTSAGGGAHEEGPSSSTLRQPMECDEVEEEPDVPTSALRLLRDIDPRIAFLGFLRMDGTSLLPTRFKLALVGGGKSSFGSERRKTLVSVRTDENLWAHGFGQRTFPLHLVQMEERLGQIQSHFDKVEAELEFPRASRPSPSADWPLEYLVLRAGRPEGVRLLVENVEVFLYFRNRQGKVEFLPPSPLPTKEEEEEEEEPPVPSTSHLPREEVEEPPVPSTSHLPREEEEESPVPSTSHLPREEEEESPVSPRK